MKNKWEAPGPMSHQTWEEHLRDFPWPQGAKAPPERKKGKAGRVHRDKPAAPVRASTGQETATFEEAMAALTSK